MKNVVKSKKNDQIAIFGAREHNLKNINVTIPKGTLTVITGHQGQARAHWRLISCLQRVNAVIWSLFHPMRDNFWALPINLT